MKICWKCHKIRHFANICRSAFKGNNHGASKSNCMLISCNSAKKRDAKEIKDFRPISLLSNLGKIFERIIWAKLDRESNISNCISNNQFGFREKHGTENALLLFANKITEGLRNRRTIVVMDIDLEKAFDRMWHKGLLFKLINLNCLPGP